MTDGPIAAISRIREPMRLAAALVGGLAASGCVFVPTTIATYDPDCQVIARHMVLEPVQIAAINHCSNQGCTMMVVAGAATAAASAIVSGSIAVVGNVAYWFERRAGCRGPVVVTPNGPPVIAPGTAPQPLPAPQAAPASDAAPG